MLDRNYTACTYRFQTLANGIGFSIEYDPTYLTWDDVQRYVVEAYEATDDWLGTASLRFGP